MLTLNDVIQKKMIKNTSNFLGATINNIRYDKPVTYIKAYLTNMLNEAGVIDYGSCRKHFESLGIAKSTVLTQLNLFKKNMIEKGKIDIAPKLNFSIKNTVDLINFDIIEVVVDNKKTIINKALSASDLKIQIPTHNGFIVVTEKQQ